MMPTNLRQSAAPAWLLIALVAACAEFPAGLEYEAPPVFAPPTNSAEFTGDIRLGLVTDATELQLGGTDAFAIRDKVTGATIVSGAGEAATITFVNQSIPGKTSFRLLTLTCATEAERDAYVADAAQKETEFQVGFVTYVLQSGDCWKVYLGDLGLSSASSSRTQFRKIAEQRDLATLTDQWFRVTTVSTLAGFRIRMGTVDVTAPNFISLEPAAGRATVNGEEVDGRVTVFRNASETLTAVSEVPLEQYLRRVVPLVLPPDSYGVAEAQKAHAVAERTRALYNFGRHAAEGFDFYAGEYQPYGGPEVEHEVSTAAIDATAGIVATFEGLLIDTPFHPASGGWTANSEDVFEPVVPYLRGINESHLPWGLQKKLTLDSFTSGGGITDLRGVLKNERGVWSKFTYWKVDWSKAEMAAVLSAKFGVPVENVTAVRTVERGTYARVRRMEFDTDAGTLVAEKHDIRSKLSYITLEGEYEPLSSTLFFIVPILSSGEVTGWRAYGAGLGHGVGMSQIGAVMMAEQGATFEDIVTTYYTNATIEQR